jgi:hypothetical protein
MAFNEQFDDNFWRSLLEFDSMDEANAALGARKPFLASKTNTEGWSWREVFVTPYLGPVSEVELVSCLFNIDSNFVVRESGWHIDSAVFDGIQYASEVDVPNTGNVVVIGGYNYNTDFVDYMNTLGIPNVVFEYPTEEDMDLLESLDNPGSPGGYPHPWNSFRMTRPAGMTFTILTQNEFHKLTETWSGIGFGVGDANGDGYWEGFEAGGYVFSTIGCDEES